MWREAGACHPLRNPGQDGWESEDSETLIYPREPLGFWHGPDIVYQNLPPAIIASSKGTSEHFAHVPHYLMAADGFHPLYVGRLEANRENDQLQTTCHNDYQAAMNQMEAHLSMVAAPAPSSFQAGQYVSPVVSPDSGFSANQWMPPPNFQTLSAAYTWSPACQPNRSAGYEGYQTVNFGPHSLPSPYYNNWGYVNGPGTMPTDSDSHIGHAGLPNTAESSSYTGGSFSSAYSEGGSFSSTLSSSFRDDETPADAYPPRAFHNSTPFDRLKELSSSPPSPENYFASSASSPGTMQGTADSDAAHSSVEALPSAPSRPKKRTSRRGKGRKQLPENSARGLHARRRCSPPPLPKLAAIGRGVGVTPAPPSFKTRRHSRNTRSSNISTTTTTVQPSSEPQVQLLQVQPQQHDPRVARQARLCPAPTVPPPRPALPPPPPSSAASSPPPQHARHLSEKDELLIHYREAGLGYSEIQQLGGFKEAVSTLRGRYRTLTKPKEARVRRPAWTDHELRLLEQGVRSFASGSSDLRAAKVPWMHVAAYIKDNGGYHFGNSTCRKRWDELFADAVAAGKDPTRPFYRQWSYSGAS